MLFAQDKLMVAIFVVGCGLFAGCSCSDEPVPAAPSVAPAPAPSAAPVEEPQTSAAVDPQPGPFVRGVRGGPLLRLGADHSGELVIQGDTAALHVIHRSRRTLPATGEVSLRIKPVHKDELALVMTPAADGERWVVTVPEPPGEAEAVVTMQIEGKTVTGAIMWAEAEGGPPPPRSAAPPVPEPDPLAPEKTP